MKTQQEVNNFFQENTVHVNAIYQIVQYLKDFNLKLPNNVILHEKGIDQAHFFKWFDNGPFKPGDVLVSAVGNLVLFSHLERDIVYYHCILDTTGGFRIAEKTDCGVGKSKDCYLASDVEKQRLLDELKNSGHEFDSKTNSLKKFKYPKTYKKCCEIVNACHAVSISYDSNKDMLYNDEVDLTILALRKLIICYNAYLKIAGEEMELGKPWEPKYPSNTYIYTIETNNNKIICNAIINTYKNRVLSFPTEEMRDAFYENFKDLIEKCKELL